MRTNLAYKTNAFTHEGGPAKRIDAEAQLRRLVMSCLLWENQFYIDGKSAADQIVEGAKAVSPTVLRNVAIDARHGQHLRHAPLLLLSVLAETGKGNRDLVADAIAVVINRADELAELLSVHMVRNGVARDKLPGIITNPMRLGLAAAFHKFDEYQLAKYDRSTAIRLRDVLFLCHAKPGSLSQEDLWRRLVEGKLVPPDTWEVGLSGGGDKRETFERLLNEGRLGYLALLRNLRNMSDSGVDATLVHQAIIARKGAHNVLPFRYVAAARAAPRFEPSIDQALCEAIAEMSPLSGETAVLIDVSGSMDWKISARSDMTRMDAAAALGAIVPGKVRLFTFSRAVVEIPPRRGMSGIDAIVKSQPHSGTYLGAAVTALNRDIKHDRLIVITDEQTDDKVPDPVAKRAYMINVASDRNGVGYGRWTHIDGWSDGVLKFINAHERG